MAESVQRKLENADLTKENTLFVKFKNAERGAFSFLLLFLLCVPTDATSSPIHFGRRGL
jgi:hypothetical protein